MICGLHSAATGVETQLRRLSGADTHCTGTEEAPDQLQRINNNIMWGSTAEVFKKGKEIIQIFLKAGFAIRQINGPAQEIRFLGIKRQDGHHQIPVDAINKIPGLFSAD